MNRLKKTLRQLLVIPGALFLSSCYIEGGGCNGPFCFGVSTQVCGNGLYCDDNDEVHRCPDSDDIERNALLLINQARASAGNCAFNQQHSAGPIVWNEQLFGAADLHSRDMAGNNFLDALGSDGLGVRDRLGNANTTYITQSVAGGFSSTGELIRAWRGDDSECAKLTNDQAAGFALACRFDGNSDYGTYWTLVMAGE